MSKSTEIEVQLQIILTGVIGMISARKILCEDFIKAVIARERESNMDENALIRPRTLRNWISYVENGTFKPHRKLVKQHFDAIEKTYSELSRPELILENNKTRNAVYLLREEPFSGFVKIGNVTAGTLHARIKALQTGNPRRIVLVKYVALDTPAKVLMLERLLHGALAPLRTIGEWFTCNDLIALQLYGCMFDMIRAETLLVNYKRFEVVVDGERKHNTSPACDEQIKSE